MRQMMAAIMAVTAAMPSFAEPVSTTIAASAPVAAVPSVPGSIAPVIVTLPAATEIWLAPARDVSSKNLHLGDSFPMQVSRDVFVHRVLVIPRGTSATAKIVYRTGKGVYGKSAKIEFDLVNLEVAHRPVTIAGHYRVEGEGNSTATVVVLLLTGAIWPLLITGHSAVIRAGSEWRATTSTRLEVALDGDAIPVAGESPVRLAAYRRPPAAAAVAIEHDYPLNSAYTAPPAEIFIRSLPPRP